MNLYISDLHIGHSNVLRFDNRPFKSVEEMDKKLIENINNVATRADHLYILGDLLWKNTDENFDLLKNVKPNMHLITGNHDRVNNSQFKKLFEEIVPYKEVKDIVDGKEYHLILSHYPLAFWNKQHHGTIHLYGHVHNTIEEDIYQSYIDAINNKDIKCSAYNVGCMYWNYTPVTLKQILENKER